MSRYTSGQEHRCHAHGLPNCRRPHQTMPYVRPDTAHQISADWQMQPAPIRLTRLQTANPITRWMIVAMIVLIVSAVILIAAAYAGTAAAGASYPQPTPYPNGWTP